MMNTREINLRRLNSATKYPSIPTYHAIGERGVLLEEAIALESDALIVTEKVDGTNSRMIVMPDGYFLIGSREELLHARGDLVCNPALGIVETLRATAERIVARYRTPEDTVTTVYLETYGGKTTAAAKQYTSCREFGYRVFDVSRVSLSRLEEEPEAIALWRENGGQEFLDEGALAAFVAEMDLELTPRIAVVDGIPTSIEATHEWLIGCMPTSLVKLDEAAGGRPEGVVVRTNDRRQIVKIRYEDYERTAKRYAKQRSK
ncbi:RNA ligase family protein [Blastopirellula sp. JC732]|uniref:RNA ligase family protein n=1 Tax=Blastopirellula sediminis TaxID=2894196 RepID=A0A9X1MHL2_9BACT|nr:RNA ligase family protein [Blastopirellula sediminis]MCC9607949.1 RNA ligase family protein [Blastopirellula sediminis]MCC9627258.1 RNA ligase family protein [Blastopirellula sediminis]